MKDRDSLQIVIIAIISVVIAGCMAACGKNRLITEKRQEVSPIINLVEKREKPQVRESEDVLQEEASASETDFQFENVEVFNCSKQNEYAFYDGVNNYGEAVWHCVDISFDVPAMEKYKIDAQQFYVKCTWDEVYNGAKPDFGYKLIYGAHQSYTDVEVSEICKIDEEEVERYQFRIGLPDDPDIAGSHTIIIHMGEAEMKVHLTLIYEGDYRHGTGWNIRDIRINDMKAEGPAMDAARRIIIDKGDNREVWESVDVSKAEMSFFKIGIEDVEVGLRVASNQNEFDQNKGIKNNGEKVGYAVSIYYDFPVETRNELCKVQPSVECSWGEIINGPKPELPYEMTFHDLRQGKTCLDIFRMFKTMECITPLFNVVVGLPDNPDIAGPQTITVHVGEKDLIVGFTLNYEGDYTYGTGWDIQDVEYKVVKCRHPEIRGEK